MVISSSEDLFSLIEKNPLTVVLFLTPQLASHKSLRYFSDKDIIKFFVDEENSKDFQIVKVPQIRVYKFGNEIINLFGNELLNYENYCKGYLNAKPFHYNK